jgi:hypothetical protein
MPTYELVITDVTQYGALFCVAGWDLLNGGMIRPEPPTMNATAEASRFWTNQHAGPGKFFAVGNIVRFDANAAPAHSPFPHATEDRLYVGGSKCAMLGQMTPHQLAQSVAPGVSASIAQTFGGHLQRARSSKAHVAAGEQTRSLDAIEIPPAAITFYEASPKPGKRQLRAVIAHGGLNYDLSVPADAAKTRFLTGGITGLRADVQPSQRIHVRLGLCRPSTEMPDSCYAQVNGLYCL